MVLRSASRETTPLRRALLAKGDEKPNELVVGLCRGGEHVCQAAESGYNRRKRELQKHRAHGAAKDDQSGSRLQDLAQVAAFDQQPRD